jgi:3-deoxy-D-manno-octulosonic-acid transferase
LNISLYRTIYHRVILPLIWGGSHLFALFIPKIRDGLEGRKGLTGRVARFRSTVKGRPVILFHCASAGELEALKPLSKEFDRSRVSLVVSYFSPSARSSVKNTDDFDYADYSPIDSPLAVRDFFDALNPAVIAITKHDIWPAFVWEAQKRKIPLFLINGNFHSNSLRLWPLVRQFHAAVYQAFAQIMTVSEDDAIQARRIVGSSVPVSAVGDSRFDRVAERVAKKLPLPEGLEELCRGFKIIIAGSTHADDEQLILPVLPRLNAGKEPWRAIIVPHDPSPKARRRILDMCSQYGLSVFDLDHPTGSMDAHVILLNRTGVLADLYRIGHVAYVGGGFGKGVHSVLEPMASGVPVVCGPNIIVSNEARVAQAQKILTVVADRSPLEKWLLDYLNDAPRLQHLREQVLQFVRERTGVSKTIGRILNEALHGGTPR